MVAKHALRLWAVSGLSYETVAKTRERERERAREKTRFS
jgi:hypothetical protein